VQREVGACKGTGSSLLLRGELLFFFGGACQGLHSALRGSGRALAKALGTFHRDEFVRDGP
jgi:hypothetical protein